MLLARADRIHRNAQASAARRYDLRASAARRQAYGARLLAVRAAVLSVLRVRDVHRRSIRLMPQSMSTPTHACSQTSWDRDAL